MSVGIGRLPQEEIYLGGLRGRRQAVPVAADALEELALKSMSRRAFAYVAGGAGLESTIEANRAAFERRRIVPRMLHDVAERDTSFELFSREAREPVPARADRRSRAGAQGRRPGRRARRRGRGRSGDRSNQASVAMEDCAQAMRERPALAPALLEHLERARRELRPQGRGLWLRGDRDHARHDALRLAPAGSRPRLLAVRARQGDRAVHERPRLQSAGRRARRREHDRRRAAHARDLPGADPAREAREATKRLWNAVRRLESELADGTGRQP